jgi:hypothetical protein
MKFELLMAIVITLMKSWVLAGKYRALYFPALSLQHLKMEKHVSPKRWH